MQVRSSKQGREETTLIFMRIENGDARLLVTTIEPREATVVHLKLNPAGLRRWMDRPRGEASSSRFHAEDEEP